MSDHRTPDAPGLWKAAHGGYGVMFHDDGEPAMLLFGPGAKVRALDAIGPYTRLQPGVPVGSAPVPNLPGLWMDKDGSLYFLSDGRRVWRIRDNREWMGGVCVKNSGCGGTAEGRNNKYIDIASGKCKCRNSARITGTGTGSISSDH